MRLAQPKHRGIVAPFSEFRDLLRDHAQVSEVWGQESGYWKAALAPISLLLTTLPLSSNARFVSTYPQSVGQPPNNQRNGFYRDADRARFERLWRREVGVGLEK